MCAENVGQTPASRLSLGSAAPAHTPAATPTPGPATPAAAAPAAPKTARDGLATTPQARQQAAASAQSMNTLLAKADLQNRGLDQVFGQFQARASAEDALRKEREKNTGEAENKKQDLSTAAAKDLKAAGKVALQKLKALEKTPDADGDTFVEEEKPDIYGSDDNSTTERQKVDDLPEGQREAYERCASIMVHEPEARQGLQKLLLNGDIPGLADSEGRDLLTNLGRLAGADLDPSMEPLMTGWELVAGVLIELANVGALASELGPTPQAALLLALASTRPAEYTRLLTGLATLDGRVKLANGRTLSRRERLRAGERRWGARLLRDAFAGYEDDDEEAQDEERRRKRQAALGGPLPEGQADP